MFKMSSIEHMEVLADLSQRNGHDHVWLKRTMLLEQDTGTLVEYEGRCLESGGFLTALKFLCSGVAQDNF